MDPLIEKVISKLNKALSTEALDRTQNGGLPLEKVHLTILGQFSLLADNELSNKLTLAATLDFDAIIKGDAIARSLLKLILENEQLDYDDLSNEIWMPKETIFRKLFESEVLLVETSLPIYTLTSKAIKSPQKNRSLIKQSLKIYDQSLRNLIIHYGGDLKLFES